MNSSLIRPVSRALFASLSSVCAVASADPAAETTELENVVISATRIEQPIDTVGSSITLLAPDQIRDSQKTSVADVLVTTPGVTLSRNGGLGTTTSVRIRGAEGDQTVVLIDGVKLNDPSSTSGGYNFANLITSDVARIEVLRGPQSTLWGSQAIGGVVNIVTPEPNGPLSAHARTEAGSRNTGLVKLSAEAGGDVLSWRVGAGYLTTDGVSAFDEKLGGREKDGYRNTGLNARGIVHITQNIEADLRATWSKGRVDFDGFPAPAFAFADTAEYGKTEELASYAGLRIAALDGRLRNRVGFAYTDTDRENVDPAAAVPLTFDASGSNKRWEYQGTYAFSERTNLTLGLESETSELSTASPSSFNPNPTPLAREIDLDSAYAQLQFAPVEAVSFSVGTRYDDHETFGSHTTNHASVAWSVMPATVVRASYGEGFKAPTLYQLFSEYGNTALEAESAHGWDAGIEQKLLDDAVALSAIYFSRDTNNMIDFVSCFGVSTAACAAQPNGYYNNIQKASADGVELGASVGLGSQVRISANYTTMDVRNDVRGSANFERQLPRRPRESLNGSVTWASTFGLTTTVAIQRAGRSFDNVANSFVLDGYTLVDLRAAYDVSEWLQVYGRVENLLDEEYQTTRRYGSLGRGVFAGVRWNF